MYTPERLTRPQYIGRMRALWRQGEHVLLVGPTGAGKTTLARDLLGVRSYVVVMAIKAHDDSIEQYRRGYKIITSWPPEYNVNRCVLWIKPRDLSDIARQRAAIRDALQSIYLAGGWCVYLDDLSFLVDHMGLRNVVTAFLNQGRSNGISVVSAVQRPRRVPLEAFNQARHIVTWRYSDRQEAYRVAEIAGYPAPELWALMADLGPFDSIALSVRQRPVIVEG